MSKRRANRELESPDDAVLFADTAGDPDMEAFLHAMERRSARRRSREARRARRMIEESVEERWLKSQIDDWYDSDT